MDKQIQAQIETIGKRYPTIDKAIVKDIILSSLGVRAVGFLPACEIERQLGLSNGYFKIASYKNYEIKAIIIKDDTGLMVKLHDEISNLLKQGFICNKITKEEIEDYDQTINLTKSTILGFYK